MNSGKQFLSSLKLHSDYLKWLPERNRYETWPEAIEDVKRTHMNQALRLTSRNAPGKEDDVREMVDRAFELVKQRRVLPSMRTLQFRESQIQAHQVRLFNCSTTYCCAPDVFAKGLYVLLCGAGLGMNMHSHFIDMLPRLKKRTGSTKTFVIQDSIEGWADAANVLVSSYCAERPPVPEYQGCPIKFDFSLIRPKGAMISGGFKAPGSEGLRKSLEKIESLLDKVTLSDSPVPFEDIVAYDIFMHLADSVLSGGVRRSATIVMFGDHQEKMVNAKTGNWFNENPQRARSNNSVMIPSDISKEELRKLLNINDGTSDLGFVRVENIYSVYNPCAEIKFSFFDQIKNKNSAVFSFCNLCEINAEGNKDAAEFYEACVAASVIGTIQASFTHFPYLGEETSRVVEGEALLGVSVTGWMNAPWLFDEKILLNGVDEVKATNHLVSLWLGINPSARLTCVKPSGNASALLGTSSGIHAEHSRRFFRIMQLNKESTVAKWLEASMPEVLEESQWSATNSDYVVYVPVTIADNAITKEDLTAIDHLEKVKLVQRNWVLPGKVEERCYDRSGSHNVSVTVIVDDMAEVVDYMHENLSDFTAVSFLPRSGDRDYVQAPFTSVKTSEEIYKEYGDAAMLASGLVVDGLHVFSNLWRACDHVTQRDLKFEGTRYELVLQKDWVRRAKKFAKNFFKGNLERMILCLKDVHLLHKWHTVNRTFKVPDLGTLLDEPEYVAADTLAAAACHGGKCDI